MGLICGRGYFCSFENLMVIFVVSSNVVVIFAVFPIFYYQFHPQYHISIAPFCECVDVTGYECVS